MKKTLLIVVDAIASRVVKPAMAEGKLPNLKALSEAGSFRPESIAIFPSITPAATSSIITGQYPRAHGVLGFHWYDLRHDTVVYYGDDFWVIWREGFGEFFDDFLNKLNHQRLRGETLFQTVERSGLKAANLNYLIFRGDVKHKANVPFWISLLPEVPTQETIFGPSILYFGDLVDSNPKSSDASIEDEDGGIFSRFSFDDPNTASLLLQLAEDRALPDFTLAYFPDNDFRSHELGPEAAVTTLQNVDKKLGDLALAFGGLEEMLNELCIVLTGDHSQTDVIDDEERAGILLDEILSDFSVAEPGLSWDEEDEIMICPDMRSAQIYFQELTSEQLDHAVELLLADPRVDQAIWRAEDLGKGQEGYYIATQERGRLRFWPGADGRQTVRDQYNCPWSWTGNLNAVDGHHSANSRLTFPNYPNAFERIMGGLATLNSGHLWVTAQPGYEFRIPEMDIHVGGGSHGSLHALDSLSPLLLAGAPEGIELPPYPRAVDVNPLCLSVLDIESARPVGTSRISKS